MKLATLLILGIQAIIQASLPIEAYGQGRSTVHTETYWQQRSSCDIRSANYTGPCVLTVISFGKSMNIHFDINELGPNGLSFIGNRVVTTSHGAILQVLGVLERFNGPDQNELVPGECVVDFSTIYSPDSGQKAPWDETARIICTTEDGRFNATAQ